jgi:hypothetical protein
MVPERQLNIGGICDACIELENVERKSHEAARAIETKWLNLCPEVYQDTEIDLLPHPDISQKALRWPCMLNDLSTLKTPWMGLNLWGFSRQGKTRTLFLILKKAHYEGKRIKFFGPSEFAQQCEMREFKTASWIRGLTAYDIIAFDDIDKCKLTRQQEEKFFAVLDARIAHRLPIFFTGNTQGDKLKLQFKNGEAIVARMREHCYSIHFPQQQQLQL